MSARREKISALVLLLFAASAANALPTASVSNPIVGTSQAPSHRTPARTFSGLEPSGAVCGTYLAGIGKSLLEPQSYRAGPRDSEAGDIRPLPGVPTATAMVLTGFICISLTRDRRAWVAAFAGLLCAGHTGIQALPKLACRLSRTVHTGQHAAAILAAPCHPGDRFHTDGYSKRARYTGLLRRLAGIPQGDTALANGCRGRPTLLTRPRRRAHRAAFGSVGRDTRILRDALFSPQFASTLPFNRLVSIARQFVCFSPAFIFQSIPRGPPMTT